MRPLGPLTTVVLLLAVQLLPGCGAPGASQPPEPPYVIVEPGGAIMVEQTSGQVVFSFLIQRTPGTGDLIPTAANDLVVKKVGHDAAIWSIFARGTGSTASRIVYGVVPAGFIQDIPANARAPKLEKGVTYSVATRWAGQRFTFRGD